MGLFASRVKIGKTHKLVENVHIVKRGVCIPLAGNAKPQAAQGWFTRLMCISPDRPESCEKTHLARFRLRVARLGKNAMLPHATGAVGSSSNYGEATGMRYWTECREFFGQFRRHYCTTGSIMPSSRALARALTGPMRRRTGRARILEVGPGTGAVTAEILRLLRPGDWLDIVEINEHFVAVLEKRFAQEPLWHSRQDQVRLIHSPLQDVAGEGVYDYMISGLPLNNFPLALVRDIFKSYRRLLKANGVLSYFEYLLIRPIKMQFVSKRERQRLHVLGRYLERKIRAGQFREDWVFLNVPPAVARHFRFDK